MSDKMLNQAAIGVYDSGMGGLTVLKELKRQLPNESFIYLGDTARLPYGTKSAKTVVNYALQMGQFLAKQNIKLLVVACNTATTAALTALRQTLANIPVVGVIEPGAKALVQASLHKRVLVLATETTIRSGVYQETIKSIDKDIEVKSQACGLFVALCEEGMMQGDIPRLTIEHYLKDIYDGSQDGVLLGCTHFPLLKQTLAQYFDHGVNIVDSAIETAKEVKSVLQKMNLKNLSGKPKEAYFVTDLPERFIRIGQKFLCSPIAIDSVELIDAEKFTKTEMPYS